MLPLSFNIAIKWMLPEWMPDAPGVDAPGVDAPGVDAPGVDAPGVDAPGVDAPGVDAPGVDAPGVDAPGVDAPGVDAPGVDAPVSVRLSYSQTNPVSYLRFTSFLNHTFPFLVKLVQKCFHILMACFSHLSARSCIHPIFE